MQKKYLNLTLAVLVIALGFVTGTLLAQTPGSVFHRAEEIKPGEVGKDVGAIDTSSYKFPNVEATKQITAGTSFVVGGSSLTGTVLTVSSGGTSSIGGNLNISGNVGIGTANSGEKLEVNGNVKLSGSTPTYKVTNLAAPTATSDAATKAYVDAAGGGGVNYWSIQATPNSYNGNLGGYQGYLTKCETAFGSGAIPFSSLLLSSAIRGGQTVVINFSANGYYWWEAIRINVDAAIGGGSSTNSAIPASIQSLSDASTADYANCEGWVSTDRSGSALIAGDSARAQCTNALPLLCAVPK